MQSNNKINISFIMYGGLTYGGAHRQAIRLASVMNKDKFNIHYFWCRHNKDKGSDFSFPEIDLSLAEEMKKNGVEVIEFNVGFRDIALSNHPWFETDFFQIFEKYPTDIVFGVRAGYPEFPFVHLQKPIVEWNVFGCVDRSDNLVASISVSPWIQQKWIQNGGFESLSSVCYSGLNAAGIEAGDLRKELGIKKNEIAIGFHQRKDDNIYGEQALIAFSQIKNKINKKVKFLILGGSEKYKDLSRGLEIEAIFLPVTFDYKKISLFLNTLDIYTHSGGAGETLGIAIQEAMMHGLPIVSMFGENNGHVDVIGESGKVCKDIDEYRDFLFSLIQNNVERRLLGSYARQKAENEFSINKVAQFFERVFADVYNKYVKKNIEFKIQSTNIYFFYKSTVFLKKIINKFPHFKNFLKSSFHGLRLVSASSKYLENDPFYLYKIKPKIIFWFWRFFRILSLKKDKEIIIKKNEITFNNHSGPETFIDKFLKKILKKLFVESKFRFVLNNDYELRFTKKIAKVNFRSRFEYLWNPKDPYSLLGMPLRGDFEPLETDLILRLTNQNDIIFDVGANFGWYSVVFGKNIGPGGSVHAFEPLLSVIEDLKNNIKLNNLQNIVVNFFGLSNTNTRSKIYVPKIYGTAFASLRRLNYDQNCDEITIFLKTLDDYCQNRKINKIDFIKIDVEGAEALVLNGGKNIFAGPDKPLMLIEINDLVKNFGFSRSDVVGLIRDFGYEVYEIYKDKLYKILDIERDKKGGYNYFCVPLDKKNKVFSKVEDLLAFY